MVVDSEKALLEINELWKRSESPAEGNPPKDPQVQTTQAQSSSVSREHRRQQSWRSPSTLAENGERLHRKPTQFKFESLASAPTSELPAPLNHYLWMEKYLGSFPLLLIPPWNLHICLERSSKYSFQVNPSISKFLSLFAETCKALKWPTLSTHDMGKHITLF